MFSFIKPLQSQPQIFALLVLVALVLSGNGLVAPVLSLYAGSFGVGSALAGMIITVFGIARLLSNVPAGFLSQRLGLKALLIAGPAIIVLGSIGAALAEDFWLLLFWRFVQGVGSGIYMTTATAAVAGMAPPGRRGRVMALFQTAILLGAGAGPVVGGLVAERWGLAAPFWAYAIVCAGAVVVALFTRPPDLSLASDAGKEISAPRPLLSPLLIALCTINFGVFFTRTAAMWQMIPVLAHDVYGMGLDIVGAALALTTFVNFAVLPITGWAIDTFGARGIAFWSGLATVLALGMIATISGPASLWTGLVVLGLAGGFHGPAIGALAADVIPPEQYGPGMGLFRSGGDAGFVIGPVLVGWIADIGSFSLVGGLAFNALLVLATAFLLLPAIYRRLGGDGTPKTGSEKG